MFAHKRLFSVVFVLFASAVGFERLASAQSPSDANSTRIMVSVGDLTMPAETAAWLFGKSVAFASRYESIAKAPEKAEPEWNKARLLANALNVELPPYPKKGGMWAIRKFVMDGEDSVRAKIEKKYSEQCGALFSLPAEVLLTVMMYSETGSEGALKEQADLNKFMSNKLKVAAVDSKLQTFIPLVEMIRWVDANKPSGDEFNRKGQAVILKMGKRLQRLSVASDGGKQTADQSQYIPRRVAWSLGQKLSTEFILKMRGKEHSFEEEFTRLSKFSNEMLGVQLPKPPSVDGLGDLMKAREYLFGKSGSVRAELEKKYPKSTAGLVNLSGELMFSGLLYQMDEVETENTDRVKELSTISANAVRSAAIESKLQDHKPLLEVISWMVDLKPTSPEFTNKKIAAMNSINAKLRADKDSLPSVSNIETPLDAEAKRIALQIVSTQSSPARTSLQKLKPTLEICRKVFDSETAESMFAMYDKLYADGTVVTADKEQTEVLLEKITSDELIARSPRSREFPGGYRVVAPHLKPGFTIYEVNYVRPGAERGMRYDGLVKVDGDWYFFFKMWRGISEDTPPPSRSEK